jgi:hypothetical protein
MLQKIENFSNSICIYDEFIENKNLIKKLKAESKIKDTIAGQDIFNFTPAQKEFHDLINPIVLLYCIENNIDIGVIELNNFQKGMLKKYDQSMVTNHLYEPHHDIAEGGYITALYYVDSDYSEEKWVGGELAIYEKLSFVDYPGNTINILPKPNRLILFPGFYVHRVKPYFGKNPRTSIVMGWGVKDSVKEKCIMI